MSIKNVMVKKDPVTTGLVKALLHAHIGGYEKPRPKKTIHASELTYGEREFCPRQYRLMDLYEDAKDPARHIDVALDTTFAEGRAKQHDFNNVWLRDRMVGDWQCTSCRKVAKFTPAPPPCGSTAINCNWEYREVRIEDAVAGHSGGLDGLVVIAEGKKLRLVEYKILANDMFKALKGPLAEHRVRTQLYLRTIARSKQPWAKKIDTKEASVVYQMRGFGMKDENGDMSPFREYTITRNDKGVEDYAAMAHAVTASRRDESLGMPCGICTNMLSDRAKQCPVAKQCFGTKHPGTITWTRLGVPTHSPEQGAKFVVDGTSVQQMEKQ